MDDDGFEPSHKQEFRLFSEDKMLIVEAWAAVTRIVVVLFLLVVFYKSFKWGFVLVFFFTLPLTSYYAIQSIPHEFFEPLIPYIPQGTGYVHYTAASVNWQLFFYRPVYCMEQLWVVMGSLYAMGNAVFVGKK